MKAGEKFFNDWLNLYLNNNYIFISGEFSKGNYNYQPYCDIPNESALHFETPQQELIGVMEGSLKDEIELIIGKGIDSYHTNNTGMAVSFNSLFQCDNPANHIANTFNSLMIQHKMTSYMQCPDVPFVFMQRLFEMMIDICVEGDKFLLSIYKSQVHRTNRFEAEITKGNGKKYRYTKNILDRELARLEAQRPLKGILGLECHFIFEKLWDDINNGTVQEN